ncbi:PEGA domain-containing protein [Nitrospira defluvii]|nr:PEGA domain-containing protein [Nitrospira defluvii]
MMGKKQGFFLLIILLSGCATLFSDRSDTLSIRSEPSGADIYLGAEKLGQAPLVRTFKRETFNQVTLSWGEALIKLRFSILASLRQGVRPVGRPMLFRVQ